MDKVFRSRRALLGALGALATVGSSARSVSAATSSATESPQDGPPVRSGLSPGIPRRLARAKWIAEAGGSKGAPVVYVFTDPECPYCHRLWEAIHSLRPKVEFRYLLVGIIGPRSLPKAAAILQSSDPAVTLAEHEARFDRGGISPAKTIRPDVKETLSIHESLMESIGTDATPALIYETRSGDVRLMMGLPSRSAFDAMIGDLK